MSWFSQEEYRCHSCYAFAAVGALEGAHAIQTGQLTALSAQQIVDCSSNNITNITIYNAGLLINWYLFVVGRYANSACQGGNFKFSWNYIIHNGGVDKASYYPYKPKVIISLVRV